MGITPGPWFGITVIFVISTVPCTTLFGVVGLVNDRYFPSLKKVPCDVHTLSSPIGFCSGVNDLNEPTVSTVPCDTRITLVLGEVVISML